MGNNVLPSVIVKYFGVFGSHSLVLLEAAVGSVGCMDRGGVFLCLCACVWLILADCGNELGKQTQNQLEVGRVAVKFR